MDQLIVKDALQVFYEDYHLEADGGMQDTAVKVALFKGVFIYFPNFKARKKVLLKHDIHHLLTGYTAKMKGETEISAWELSTGCTHNWFAFIINTNGMMAGFPFNLKGIWKAWLRGKSSKNLYQKKYNDEHLLYEKVAELKNDLGLMHNTKGTVNTFYAFLTFILFILLGVVTSLAFILLIPFIIAYSLVITVKKTEKNN